MRILSVARTISLERARRTWRQVVVRALFAAGVLLLTTLPAAAATITLDFNFNTGNFVYIDSYYDGGTLSNGFGPGPDYDVTFVNAQTLSYSSTTQMFFPYSSGGTIFMNATGGFQDFFSFQYGWPGSNQQPTVSLYSGLNGTGTLLGQIALSNNGTYSATQTALQTLTFAGVAHSAVFAGTANFVTWDTVSFNTANAAVPEPASLLLLGTGMLAGAAQLRRRRKEKAAG